MELLREACCSALRRIRTAAADGVAQRRVRVGDCTLHRGPSQGAATNLHVKKRRRKLRRSPVSPDRNPRDPGHLVKPRGPTTRVSGEHENRHAGPTTSCSPQHAKIKKWFILYCSYTLC